MVKKSIANLFIGLGIAQTFIQPNVLAADEVENLSTCCENVVVPGEPLDPCLVGSIYPLPAGPTFSCGWNSYVRGDFLYWSVYPAAQGYEVEATTNNHLNSRILNHHITWRPGFRVGIGTEVNGVYLDIDYTQIHSHSTTHYKARQNANPALSETLTIVAVAITFPFNYVKSTITQNYDAAIFSVQKPVYVGKRLVVTPSMGLIAYWSKYNTTYICGQLNQPPSGFVQNKQKNWNVGPTVAVTAKAQLAWGFRGIGSFGFSAAYDRLKSRSVLSVPGAQPALINNTTQEYGYTRNSAVQAKAELGIGWESYFWCDRYHASIEVLYAENYTAFTPFRDIQGIQVEPLQMRGLVVGGSLDF